MPRRNIKIASIIEYPIFRTGIAEVLSGMKGVKFLGNAGRNEAIAFLKEHPADIMFINTKSKFEENRKLCYDLHAFFNKLKIAFFLNVHDKENVPDYLELDINAILMKSTPMHELEYAIKVISRNGLFISQEISSGIFDSFVEIKDEKSPMNYHLSDREIQIMHMIYHEFTNTEIGSMLKISPRTVESHRMNIMRKIGVKNSIGIAKFFSRHRRHFKLNGVLDEPQRHQI